MAFCSKCGSKREGNGVFCSQCGEKFQSTQFNSPLLTPQIDRKVLDNLKEGRTSPRFLCLECGYAGPAIRVRTKFNWPAIIGSFVIFGLPSVFFRPLSVLGIIWAGIFALTTGRVMRCPKCEHETIEKGFNFKRY